MFQPTIKDLGEEFRFPFQCIFLKIFGVWPVEQWDRLAERGRRIRQMYKIYSIVVILLILITCCAQSFFFYSKWGNLVIVTECGCTVFMGIHNLLRCIHLNYKREAMRVLMQDFLSDIYVSRAVSKRIHEECEKAGVIMKSMSILLFSLICIYVLLPLFELFFGKDFEPDYQEGDTKTFFYDTLKPFPYPMLFPYDANYGLSYFLTYIYTSFSGFAVVTILFSEDSLFCYFLTHCCGRFKILHQQIGELRRTGDLKAAVTLHNDILRFCAKLEAFFSPILLVNFLISSFLICLVGFQLATANLSLLNLMKFVVYIVSNLTQLFVLCWHGHKLIELSYGTGMEVYHSQWEEGMDVGLQKGLVLMILRSQKPAKITALKFSILSLESFTKILSTSMSYFALLRTMVEED